MIALGNFLFKHRNWFFPFFYALLFIPSPALTPNYELAYWTGVGIAAFGQLIRSLTIGLVYIVRGGDDKKEIHAKELYTNGLMAHVRNPLYIGNILILLGMGIAANSLLFLTIAFPIFLLFYQAIVLAEEEYLSKQFGQAYDAYRGRIHRWLPNLNGLTKTLSDMEFSTKQSLKAEYNPTFLWLFGAYFIALKHHFNHIPYFDKPDSPQVFIIIFVILIVSYFVIRTLKKLGKFEK